MNLLDRIKGGSRDIMTVDDYAALYNSFTFNGIGYGYGTGTGYGMSGNAGYNGIQQTLGGHQTEMAANNFVGLATQAYGANGVVFACMMVRQLLFSAIRFRWQRMRDGKASDTFSSRDLAVLERPWLGATTQDLLSKMINHADLCGNSYVTRVGDELLCMRPDWTDIVVEPRMMPDGRGQIGWRKVGYIYTDGGTQSGNDPVGLLADEVVHFAPIPDPQATFRGMSWLTPILREIQADHAMTLHQRRFFDNGATVNMIIKHAPGADQDAVMRWAEQMQDKFGGVQNAYKTLNLYPGADPVVVGSNLKDIDFKNVRGGGETRIAAAAGVPPVIVGLSEGLQAATYSNYGQARRRLADGTAHPLWQNLAGSMERVIHKPGRFTDDVRLWYDADNVPFLREDEKDAAEIAEIRARTIFSLISSGFEPDSTVKAIEADDLGLLKHTGMTSVQLQEPGAEETPPAESKAIENGKTKTLAKTKQD